MRLSSNTLIIALCLPYIGSVEALGGRFARGYNYNVSTSSTLQSSLSSTATSFSGSNLESSSTLSSSLSSVRSSIESKTSTGSTSVSSSLTSALVSNGTTSQTSTRLASSSLPSSQSSITVSSITSGLASPTASTTTNGSNKNSKTTPLTSSSPSSSLTSRSVDTLTAFSTTSIQFTSNNVTTSRTSSANASRTSSSLSSQSNNQKSTSTSSGLLPPITSKHSNASAPSGFVSIPSYASPNDEEASKGFSFEPFASGRRPTGTGPHSAYFAPQPINQSTWGVTGLLGQEKPQHYLTSDGVLNAGESFRTSPPSSTTTPTVAPQTQLDDAALDSLLLLWLSEAKTEGGTGSIAGFKALTTEVSLAGPNVVPNSAAGAVAGNLPSSNPQASPTIVHQQQNAEPTDQPGSNPSQPGSMPDPSGLGNLAIGLLSAVASNAAASPAATINIPASFITPTAVQQQSVQPTNQQAGAAPVPNQQPGVKDGQDVKPVGPAVIVQSQTIAQGGPPIVINGNTVAYSSGSIYVGASAGPAPIPQQQANPNPNPAPVTVSGYQFTPIHVSNQGVTAAPAVVVQGQTLSQNAPPISISGVPLAYSAGSVYAGSSAAPVPLPVPQQQQYNQAPNPVAVGNYQFTPVPQQGDSNGGAAPAVVVQGQTLSQNAPPVSISGVPLAYSAGSVFVGTNAAPVPTVPPQQLSNVNAPNPIAIGGYTFVPTEPQGNQGGAAVAAVVVQGQTLTANGAPVTISGTPLAYSAGSVFVGNSGLPLPTIVPQQANGNAPTPITVGGYTFVPTQPQGGAAVPAVVVQGETLTANAAPITISGVPLAYSAGSVYVGSIGVPVPTAPSNTPQQNVQPAVIGGLTFFPAQTSINPPANGPIATVAGQIITQGPSGIVAVGGQTLTPGGPPVTISGTPVSLGSSILVAGGSTIQLPVPTQAPSIFTVAGQVFKANPSGFVVGSNTVKPGNAITISGTPISIATSGGATALVIGSSTIPLPTPNPLPTLTVGGQPITANSASQYIVAGQTLVPGGSAITVSGTPISLAPSASVLVVGTSTQTLATKALPSLTIGGQIITANSASQYIVAGQTLIPGGSAITASGTPISLAPSASILVVGTSTQTLATKALPTLTIGGQTITANSASQYIVSGQTLTPGGNVITISGTPVSLALSATQLVIGTSTIPLITSLPTLTIAGQAITANTASQYIVAGQTLIPGASAITVSGTLISLAPEESLLVVGTSTKSLGGLGTGLGGAILSGLGGGSTGVVGTPTGSVTYASASATKVAGSGSGRMRVGSWGVGFCAGVGLFVLS